MPDEAVIEITEPIELAIVDDRLHFVCISGKRRWPFSISFHKSRSAAHVAMGLLDEKQGWDTVRQMPKRG